MFSSTTLCVYSYLLIIIDLIREKDGKVLCVSITHGKYLDTWRNWDRELQSSTSRAETEKTDSQGWQKVGRKRSPGYQWHTGPGLTTAIPDHQVPTFLQVDGEKVGKRAGQVTQAIANFPETLHRWRSKWSRLSLARETECGNASSCQEKGCLKSWQI